MKDYIKKHKILSLILLILFIILLILPFIVNFNSKESSTDYVNYYGMILTSVFSSIVTITIFYFTLNENRRQLNEERKSTVKTYLYSQGHFNKGLSNAFFKSLSENNITYFNDKLLDVNTKSYIVWINDNFYENKDNNPINKLIKSNIYKPSEGYIQSPNINDFIRNKRELESLYGNSKFFYYKLENIGLNKALNITVYINNIIGIKNKYLSVDGSFTLILILPSKKEKEEVIPLDISICFSDVYGYKYRQYEKIEVLYNNKFSRRGLSEPKEIKEYGPLN